MTEKWPEQLKSFAMTDEQKTILFKLQYRERCRYQTLKWAMGHPYHNNIDNECCPDFSCCIPDMFEQDDDKRWAIYRKEFGIS